MRRVLFELPIVGRPLYSYGFMLGLSLVVGWYLVLSLAEDSGIPRVRARKLFLVTAVSALLGARLLFLLANPGLVDGLAGVLDPRGGGLVAYGGFLGGFLGSWLACRLRNAPLLLWADCVVPSLGTGLALTRIGCFLNGCDFGRPSSLPWAVVFPKGSLAFQAQVSTGLLASTAPASLPVHPTQLYESAIGLLLFALTMWVRGRGLPAGSVLAAFTAAYAVLRYGVETLRADPQRGGVGAFSTSQLIALGTLLAAAALAVALHRRHRLGDRQTTAAARGAASTGVTESSG